MPYSENEYILISALQHYMYCPRRYALVCFENQWSENFYTAKGTLSHENVDNSRNRKTATEQYFYSEEVYSSTLGLIGKCDCIVLKSINNKPLPRLTKGKLPKNFEKNYLFFPVEYKGGNFRNDVNYNAQLCAQAMCIEEMLKIKIPFGEIYYGKSKKKMQVDFDSKLRNFVQKVCLQVHEFDQKRKTPAITYSAKCDTCSLIGLCIPKVLSKKKSKSFINSYIFDME